VSPATPISTAAPGFVYPAKRRGGRFDSIARRQSAREFFVMCGAQNDALHFTFE
jgi:hypothetical protein